MKTMKKIVAILAVALLLCSMLPLSVFAAEASETITFDASKTQRESFSSNAQVWKSDNVTFTNNKDQSGNAVADYSNPVRLYQGSTVIIECTGMTKIVIVSDGTAKYKTALQNSLTGAGYAYTNSGNEYTVVLDGVDSITFSLTAQARFKSITVTYEAGSANCDHANLNCEETCPECGEYTKEHAWNNACDNECNNCGAANPDYAEHVYTTDYDATCNVCNESRDVTLPTTPEEIVEAAYALGKGDTFGVSTTLKGKITKIVTAYDANYANITVNMAVIDSEGNIIADKEIQCYRLKGTGADTLVVGHIIVVSGIITNFNGTIEFNAGCTLDEIIVVCDHEKEYDCSKNCMYCGLELWPEAVCVGDPDIPACQDNACDFCGEAIAALDHAFDDQWDADCNYGCGYTREVEEKPELTEATITFDENKTQRTEYSTSIQKWENDGLVLINNKAASTTNVGDYSNPGRFYKSSEIVISFPGMTSLVIDCSNTGDAKYSTPFGDMLTAAGLTYTVAEKVYTVIFAEPVDSITLSCSAQVRANSITATAAKQSGGDEPACEHDKLACGETCAVCGEYVKEHVFANNCAATCSNCTEANPNYADHVYANAYDASCNVCGAVREVILPEADSELTIEDVIALGQSKDHNSYTSGKYYVTGVITEVYNTTYGNMKLTDDKGNILTIYGTYSADGSTRYDAMENAPVVGDTVTIYGIVGQYNGTSQIKNGWITKVTKPCAHEYFTPCEQYCMICGELTNPEAAHNIVHVDAKAATCVENGNIEYWFCDVCGAAWLNAECNLNTNLRAVVLPATGEHTYDGDTDADCNVCGDVREVAIFSQLLVQFIGRMPSNDPKNRLYVSLSNDGATWTDAVEFGGHGMDVWGCANSTAGDWMTYFGTIDVTEIAKSLTSDKFYVKVGMGAGVLDQVVLHEVRVVGTYTGATTETEFFWDKYSNLPAFGRDGSNAAEAAANLKANISNIVDANNVFLQQCNVGHTATGISPYHGGFYGEPENVNGYVVYAINQELPEEPSDKVFFEIYGRLPGDVNNHVQVLVSSDGSNWNQATLWGGPDGEHSAETYAKIDITNAVDMTANNLYVKVNLISYLAEWYSIRQIRVSFVSAEGAETTLMHVIYDDMAIGSEEYKSGMYIDSANMQLRGTYDPAANDPSGLTMNEDCDGQDGKVLGDNYITYKIVLKEEPVVEIIYGDADGDGEITALDATLLDQYVAGWEVTLNEASADADGDGEITALDATLLDQYVAGWDVELGPDEPVEPEEPENKEFNDGELTEWPQP